MTARDPTSTPLHWDLFCHVIDNLGDAGVCWRLAADLAQRGDCVRLFIDEPAPLAWMAPNGHPRVQVLDWSNAAVPSLSTQVVVEAFGCELPAAYVHALHQRAAGPVWLNLEYLSAEPYVERCHALPSPQANGLTKWFFYPGFSPKTGGLLREPGLLQRKQNFDRSAWLASMGIAPAADEQLVSLFCYDNALLPQLLAELAAQKTLLLLTAAVAQQPWYERLAALPPARAAGLRVQTLPWLSHWDFDHLLWSCDLNWVRGEDSLVRALWADKPFVWQAYVQHDQAHHAKVLALLDKLALPTEAVAVWRAWNGLPGGPDGAWPGLPTFAKRGLWQAAAAALGAAMQVQQDLTTALRGFAQAKLTRPG